VDAASGDARPDPTDLSDGSGALLEITALSIQFPGVLALDSVDFDLLRGEVHVLFGENGAGKSTLIQTIAGVHQPSQGTLRFRGRKLALDSVHHARTLGISAVFQEFSLVPTLSVEDNIFLGAEPTYRGFLDKRDVRRRAKAILTRLGFPLRPEQHVQFLSRAEQQMVEIAKAFRTDPSILILDEPTASLTERETERLFSLIEDAKGRGVGIIYITHRLSEIRRIGDRITVLRDGKKVATSSVGEIDEERLLELMTGRVISQVFPKIDYRPGEILLKAERLTTADGDVRDFSFEVREGEIVGIAGLVGCGKSEAGRACFGIEKLAAGRVFFRGDDVTGLPPGRMLERGLFYLPPDRRAEGLLMTSNVRENVSLAALRRPPFARWGFLDRRGERARVQELAREFNLQPRNIERIVEHFSGGNQQKVLLAKSLTMPIRLFILDEPTVGVDVGTRVAIYEFIKALCEKGAGVLLISSDLPEILHLTNRTYVLYRGQPRVELTGAQITQDRVLGHFFERQAA
jgi:ribose transport system ATP-binding protein